MEVYGRKYCECVHVYVMRVFLVNDVFVRYSL